MDNALSQAHWVVSKFVDIDLHDFLGKIADGNIDGGLDDAVRWLQRLGLDALFEDNTYTPYGRNVDDMSRRIHHKILCQLIEDHLASQIYK